MAESILEVIPLRNLLIEMKDKLGVSAKFKTNIASRAFEDNAVALQLATEQCITSQTQYYHVKWHWFWDKVIHLGI